MRKITVDIDLYNDKEIAIELEHISQLIMDGQPEGQGWKITGEEEKEKIVEDEELSANSEPDESLDSHI